MKGTNTPTIKELEEGYLFSGLGSKKYLPNRSRDRDVTLILGVDEGSRYASILLCRFHKFNMKLTPVRARTLFQDLWDSLSSSRKYECKRTGGSSGLITKSKQNAIKKLIHVPGSCPRNGDGSIWIPGRDTWYLYYFGTYDGEVKTFKYTNPVPGGSFTLPSKFIMKYSFLMDFISTKPLSATIVEQITPLLQDFDDFNYLITPQAVRVELMNLGESRCVQAALEANDPSQLPVDVSNPPKRENGATQMQHFYAIYLELYINGTLVGHPVGAHCDFFSDGTPSLENKKCFEMLTSSIPIQDLRVSHPNGRGGGCTPGHYVFALLDWGKSQRFKRRTWIHPANAHLPNGPSAYPARQHLTSAIWERFFNPNTVTFPNGATVIPE